MALLAAYQQFLAAPSSSALADDAALYYITTTTTVHGGTEIIKHLSSQRTQAVKKRENVLSNIESASSLVIEVDTAIQFLTSGATYLPGLDANFLIDHVADLVIIHFVSFDAAGKIAQIRLCWDQGALLKHVEAIGRSGRNWPIRDSAEQTKLITTAVSGVKDIVPAAAELPLRPRGNSANAMRDPHASLELFASAEEIQNTKTSIVAPYAGMRPRQRDISEILNEDLNDPTPQSIVSPYAGRRPRQRSFTEIVSRDDYDDDEFEEDGATGSSVRRRSQSPSKAIAPKAGASKKFQPARLFEVDESATQDEAESPDDNKPRAFYRPNPKRFSHFDFADGTEPQDAPQAGKAFDALPKSKHDSHWSFKDFETPQKQPARTTGRQGRHWTMNDDDLPETPSAASRKPAAARPRPDAKAHFEFRDDGGDGTVKPVGRARGTAHNDGLGLYENNLYKEDGSTPSPGPDARALGNITNIKDRNKTYEAHFTMADVSPASKGPVKVPFISDDRQKAVNMMEANWSTFDDEPVAQKENNVPGTNMLAKDSEDRGISVGGDGMGGQKAGRSWSFGNGDENTSAPQQKTKKPNGNQRNAFWDDF